MYNVLISVVEADAIFKCLKPEKYPAIVMGDMNNIGGLYTVRRIEQGSMADAWWKVGIGYGCTFYKYAFRLRFGHILYDEKRMLLKDVTIHDAELSCHNALLASFVLR